MRADPCFWQKNYQAPQKITRDDVGGISSKLLREARDNAHVERTLDPQSRQNEGPPKLEVTFRTVSGLEEDRTSSTSERWRDRRRHQLLGCWDGGGEKK